MTGPSRPQHVWVVLPAYNEAKSLPPLLAATAKAMHEAGLAYRVLVVDDGSADGTGEVAERVARDLGLPATVERHPRNLGLGKTIRDGLMLAAEQAQADDVVVTLDADNSQPPALIPQMVRLAREGCDVVIASRCRPGSEVHGVSLFRRALSFWGGWLFRLAFPIRGVRDYTCGFRLYKARVLQRVVEDHGAAFFDQEGFQAMVDILLRLRRYDLSFGEVPLVLRYDLKESASKMKVARTIGNTLGLMLKRRFER